MLANQINSQSLQAALAEKSLGELLWILYRHQGAGSPEGQPIRAALGLGQHQRLTEQQIEMAKQWGEKSRATQDCATSQVACTGPLDAWGLTGRTAPPLSGRWHHGNGTLCSGSLRIASWDCDTCPPTQFRDEVLEWVCDTLNATQYRYEQANRSD